MRIEVTAVLLCDDVRKEMSQKDILIGVYSGRIIASAYPGVLVAAIWIQYLPKDLGNFDYELKIETPSGNPPVMVGFTLTVKEIDHSSIAIGGLPLALERDGQIKISLRESEGEWDLIKETRVMRGPSSVTGPICVEPHS